MGCSSSKEKVSPETNEETLDYSQDIPTKETLITPPSPPKNDLPPLIKAEQQKIEKSKQKQNMAKLPSIPKQKGLAFDILLTPDQTILGTNKIVLPKLQSKQRANDEDIEIMARKIYEKEEQAARNRLKELEKIQDKIIKQEERARAVLERKRENMMN